jgi:putative oxidoreductase
LLDLGFLIARVVIGLLVAAHGAQKLFGWFGGHGLQATGEFFGQLGFQPARLFATAAALTEITSGLLIALGIFGPVGPALMLAVMVVAAISVHWRNGLFASATASAALPVLDRRDRFADGPGRYSLDAPSAGGPRNVWIALAAGVLGGMVNLALRGRPVSPAV